MNEIIQFDDSGKCVIGVRDKNIETITLPNSVTSIGSYAFLDCKRLTTITIPDSVTSIGNHAFFGCSSLTSITIPNSVTSIGYAAFSDCSDLTSIDIPNSVTSMGSSAFSDCKRLISIVIPNSVTSIGSYAFSGCKRLTSIVIPNSVTSIGSHAFFGCFGLTSIDIPENLIVIGNYVFYGCKSLTNIIIPDNVTKIGNNVFEGCTSLKSLSFGKKVTDIGYGIINNCACLTSIIMASGNTKYDSRNNCNAIIETSTNTLILGCKKTIIPNSVKSIGSSAFKGCSNLTSIDIPNSVKSIGNNAFADCTSLISIDIPNSVTSIGDRAFYNCTRLTSITIPSSVTSIGESAFSNCENLSSIAIPNSVTSIGDLAFYGCSALASIIVAPTNSIYDSRDNCNAIIETSSNTLIAGCHNSTIPNNVTTIGNGAFAYCANLGSIEIPNSVISIGENAFLYCESLIEVFLPVNGCYIGQCAFSGCKSLSLKLSENVVYEVDLYTGFINESPFEGCKSVVRKISDNGKEFDAFCKYPGAGRGVHYHGDRLTDGGDWESEYEEFESDYRDWKCLSYRIKYGTKIICDIAELGLEFVEPHIEFYMKMDVIHVPASVQYIGMYALSCFNLFLEGKNVNFAKYFLTEGTLEYRKGHNVRIFIPEHTKDYYTPRLEKAIPNINYSIIEVSKENVVLYYQQQKQHIVKELDFSIEKDVETLIDLIKDFFDQKIADILASKSIIEVMSKMTVDKETYTQLKTFLRERNVKESLIKNYVYDIIKK